MTDSMVDPATIDAWARHLGRSAEPASLRAELASGTLPAAIAETAQRRGDRLALEIDGVRATHGELDRRAGRTARWLRDAGIRPGDRVLLSGISSIPLVVAYLAVLRLGAIVVPAGVASTEAELRYLLEDSAPAAALADRDVLGRLTSLFGDRSRLCRPLTDLGESSGSLEPAQRSPDDVAILAYTSGTTGRPKGAPLTHANLLSSIRAAMLAWRWIQDDLLVHALPLSHQHGLGGVHATLLAGSSAVITSRFDPAALCQTIATRCATVLFAVPTMYERLLEFGPDPRTFDSLRLAISGSAPLPPTSASRAADLLGQMPLERYGTTESGLDISNLYDRPRRPGAVGLPLPGIEAVIAEDAERPCLIGQDGEIVVRGPQVFSGYWNRPETNAETFYQGGWFRTGDIGRVDPNDGYFSITGRIKELIVTGGFNVYPREVELALEEHPGVQRAAVVGVPSEQWGEEVAAFVVARGSIDTAALSTFLRQRLSPYKRPKRILTVDALPTNALGKLDRRALVAFAQEQPPSAH